MNGPVLLLGSSGLLGSEIDSFFSQFLPASEFFKTHSKTLDVFDGEALRHTIQTIRPKWLVNAVAYTDVDKAETERQKAELLNATLPKQLAELATQTSARLVHFSTDYVFSGEGEKPWTENDLKIPPKPNWYAETKLLGENAVLSHPEHLVVRVQWLYGKRKNRFTSLRNREVFSPFIDQYGAPTWTRDLVQALWTLMNQNASGLFHFAHDDFASWMDVYQLVKNQLNLSVKLTPALTEEVGLPARRPLNGRLSNEKIKQQLGVQSLGSWKESLKEFLEQVKSD